jgi:hypothetical protein
MSLGNIMGLKVEASSGDDWSYDIDFDPASSSYPLGNDYAGPNGHQTTREDVHAFLIRVAEDLQVLAQSYLDGFVIRKADGSIDLGRAMTREDAEGFIQAAWPDGEIVPIAEAWPTSTQGGESG